MSGAVHALRVVRHPEELDALSSGWDALVTECEDRSPFLTHDWFRCCLEDSNGAELYLLAGSGESGLRGVAPLWRRRARRRGLEVRTIEFIQTRETPFADFVVRSSDREAFLGTVFEFLHTRAREEWDVLALGPWLEESPNLEAVRRLAAARGWPAFERAASVAPYVSIDQDWETFYSGRTYLFRKSRRGILNRMNRLGAVEVEVHRNDPTGAHLETAAHVSARSWKHPLGISMAGRPGTRRFFAALTEAASRRSWLLLWLLRVDGIPVAMEYDLASEGKVYALRADYDRDYHRHSCGAFLEYHIIRHLFEEGFREYNSGPGTDAYKLRWTETQRRAIVWNGCGSSLRGRLLWLAEERMVPLLRSLRDRVRRPSGTSEKDVVPAER